MKPIKFFNYSLVLFSLLPAVSLAAVPHSFATGDAIVASEMNNNFNDLDGRATSQASRITDIEARDSGGQNTTVAVDCVADVDAFINLTIQDKTTYVLTGTCNGPIQVFRKRNVIIQGDATGTKDDGVILPAGLTANPFAAISFWESNGEVRNIRIDASNYVTGSYPWGSGTLSTIGALSVGQSAITRVYDVDLVGGDYGLDVWRNSYARTYNDVSTTTITGFNFGGISAFGSSHVETRDNIQVVGGTTTDLFPQTIVASSNSFIDIKSGGTFTPAVNGSATESYSVGAYDNSTIRVRDNGVDNANLNGALEAMRGGVIRNSGRSVVVGSIGVWDDGNIRFDNSSQSGGFVGGSRNGILRVGGTSTLSVTDSFDFSRGTHLVVRGTATVATVGAIPLNLNIFSTASIPSTADWGLTDVNCGVVGQLSDGGAANPGVQTGC